MAEENTETSTLTSKKAIVSRTEPYRHWIIRMSGGPPKIVRARRDLTDIQIREYYQKSFSFRRTIADDNPDEGYPILRRLQEHEIDSPEYRHLFQASSVDPNRYPSIVEVK